GARAAEPTVELRRGGDADRFAKGSDYVGLGRGHRAGAVAFRDGGRPQQLQAADAADDVVGVDERKHGEVRRARRRHQEFGAVIGGREGFAVRLPGNRRAAPRNARLNDEVPGIVEPAIFEAGDARYELRFRQGIDRRLDEILGDIAEQVR